MFAASLGPLAACSGNTCLDDGFVWNQDRDCAGMASQTQGGSGGSTTGTASSPTGSASAGMSDTVTQGGSVSDSMTATATDTQGGSITDTGSDTGGVPDCDDGAQDGDETDIDCGGSCGPTCEDGQSCLVDGDCVSDRCVDQKCAPGDFPAGSLIIPMDIDYQDVGMLEAYGLVYAILQEGIPVRWTIAPGKLHGDVDFVASATDVQSGQAIDQHGYRGGPWVIDAADAGAAMMIVQAWQTSNPDTVVHEATAPFQAPVARLLVTAPSIAMFADGNQKIARKYMIAAKIPDSTGDPLWPDTSPDMLDPAEVSGPTDTSHHDGALFEPGGDPAYCQFMSMHWAVTDAVKNPEVVAEVREFLSYPTHFFAECQAVNAFENLDPHGFFLTTKGFLIGTQPKMYDYYQMDTPFAQIDGPFLSVGGSEPAYNLPPGESYKSSDTVMLTEAGTPIGVNDVWMTGTLDGICPKNAEGCLTAGKVSYLGGHEYDVAVPISQNPKTQGARLFLNSLYEAPCATAKGAAKVALVAEAAADVDTPQITFTLRYANVGATTATAAVLRDDLPAGTSFVSATGGGALVGDTVMWTLGNLGAGEKGSVSFTVDVAGPGVRDNIGRIDYVSGVSPRRATSNTTSIASP